MSGDGPGSEALTIFGMLFLAVLSVNQYPIEKTWARRNQLRKARLLEPSYLESSSEEEIGQGLVQAGIQRGNFITEILAERLHSVGKVIVERGQERMREKLQSLGREDLRELLGGAKGIGPVVIRNFLELRDAK